MIRKLFRMVIIGVSLSGVLLALPCDRAKNIRDKVFLALNLSHEYYLEGDFESSQKILEKALQIDPDNPILLFQKARILRLRQREDEAKKVVALAKKQMSDATDVEKLYIDVMQVNGKSPGAAKEIELRIRDLANRYPNDYMVFVAAGQFYQAHNNYTKAIEMYLRALQICPDLPLVHNNLGYMYSYVGNYDLAIQHLEKYAALVPDRPNPHDSLGELYYWTGQYDKAIAEFKKALAITPTFPAPNFNLIRTYISLAQYKKAGDLTLKFWEKADSERLKAQALAVFGDICYLEGDLEKAANKVAQAIAASPKNLEFQYLSGLIQLKAGKMNELQQTLTRMKSQFGSKNTEGSTLSFPRQMNAYYVLLAKTNLTMGNFDTSIQILRRVNENIPNPHYSMDVKEDLAEAYFAAGEFDKALETLQRVLIINPNNASCLLLQAKILTALGHYEVADKALSHCLKVLTSGDSGAPIVVEAKELYNVTLASIK